MFTLPAAVALLALDSPVPPPASAAPAQVRKAVERSLPFLKAEGVKWATNRQCHSCHHMGFMVWSLNEARRHGLDVNRDELAAWAEWSVRYGTYQGVFYQLGDPAVAALREAGLAEADAARLKGVTKLFVTDRDFRAELTKALPAEVVTRHHELILKTAAKPGQGGGGEDGAGGAGPGTVAAELLLAGASDLTPAPAEAKKALTDRLVKTQKPDGSWHHGGQFDALDRPAAESVEVNTAWNLLALLADPAPAGPVAEARTRARDFLKAAKPGASTESYVVHALLARRQGEPARADGLVKALLGQQLADGGWSWRKGDHESDAYATGEVLYALGTLGRAGADPHVRRAWAFLVNTQRDTGDWLVPSGNLRKKGPKASTDPIFSYWGTGWAVIGMLKTLPE